MRIKFLGFFLILGIVVNAQKTGKSFSTVIKKAETVIINNPTGNNSAEREGKIYVLNMVDLNKDRKLKKSILEISFGNPDDVAMHNIDISLRFDTPVDTAYFEKINPHNEKFDPFNKKSVVRDAYEELSTDKKKINYRASYIAAKAILKVIVIQQSAEKHIADTIAIEGAGKLF